MASGDAWQAGWNLGAGAAQQKYAHKQALSDQELEGKIGELIDQRKGIQAKLPTLLDDKGQPTPEYTAAMDALTKNAQDLRNIYHPQTNPSAVSRFGHLLTDALHITKPEDRIKKEAAKREAGAAADERTAQGVAAAAPISPRVAAGQQTQEDIDRQNAINDAKIAWLRKSGASPEVIQSAIQSIGGVPLTKGTKAVGPAYQDANDKKWYQRYVNSDGTDYRVEVPGYTPPQKSNAGKLTGTQLLQDSYLATIGLPYGTSWDSLSNAQRAGFELYKNKLAQRSMNRQTPITDREGNVHIVDLSSTSGPVEVAASTPQAASSNGEAGVATPQEVKKKGDNLRNSSTTTTPKKGDHVLDFKKSTPAFTKISEETNEDQRLADYADSWINIPPGQRSEEDYQFVIKMIRSNAGRVNLPEINAAFGAGGVSNWLQRVEAKTISGELPDNLRVQLQKLVHRQLDADKSSMQKMDGSPDSGQSDPDIDSIVNILNKGKQTQGPH